MIQIPDSVEALHMVIETLSYHRDRMETSSMRDGDAQQRQYLDAPSGTQGQEEICCSRESFKMVHR